MYIFKLPDSQLRIAFSNFFKRNLITKIIVVSYVNSTNWKYELVNNALANHNYHGGN